MPPQPNKNHCHVERSEAKSKDLRLFFVTSALPVIGKERQLALIAGIYYHLSGCAELESNLGRNNFQSIFQTMAEPS